jgi:valyl-tRNA synthetase
VDGALERFEFSEAAHSLYEFVWSDFCDWYLEMSKSAAGARLEQVRGVLAKVLETSLRLAHPIMPFITEEIWQRLPEDSRGESIMVAPWPRSDEAAVDLGAEQDMSMLQDIVVEVRRFRHEHGIPPQRPVDAVVGADGRVASLVVEHTDELRSLAGLGSVTLGPRPEGWSRIVAGQAEVYLPLGELVDLGAERKRLAKEIAEEESRAARARAKLDNPGFVSGAPPEVVEKVRGQVARHTERAQRLRAQLEELGS